MTETRWIPDRTFNPKTPFWTRANVGEVIPEPPSPAGWDLVFGSGAARPAPTRHRARAGR